MIGQAPFVIGAVNACESHNQRTQKYEPALGQKLQFRFIGGEMTKVLKQKAPRRLEQLAAGTFPESAMPGGTRAADKRRPTMTDVARLAGVSQSSVSLVLNQMSGARISEQTRSKVINAARQIGYELPMARKFIRTVNDRNVIAYILDEVSTSPHPVINLDGARDFGWEAGFLVSAHVTRSNPELETATIEAIKRDPAVIGIIYSTIFTRKVTLPEALEGIPTVLLNCYSADQKFPSIVPAEVTGAFSVAQYLISKGHRRIGFINGEPWMDASMDRLKGYRQALATADIAFDPSITRDGDWLPLKGYLLTLELLRLGKPPSAIFCANDLMAMGAIEAARELNLQVPDDLSIMGYDDHELARYTHPPLTTLILPNYEMGRRAAELLIDMTIQEKIIRPMIYKIDGPLVVRATVGDMARSRRRSNFS